VETLYTLQDMPRLIDQFRMTQSIQHIYLESVRADLETTKLQWEKNDHNMDVLDKVQETPRGKLLPKSLESVVLYRKMMRTVEELRKDRGAEERKDVGREDVDDGAG
jgi:hypothetical protein